MRRERLKELEKESQKPDFWQSPEGIPITSGPYGAGKERAIKISQDISQLKQELDGFEKLSEEFKLIEELKDQSLIQEFEKKLKEKEIEVFLSGKYDKNNAILSIYAGAGGQDAQDWATMLLRMYERYCQSKGWRTTILHQSFGEGGGPEGRIGTKQASSEIKGNSAYGLLKRENGVHRLVRISPFSSQKLRHTSFALVEVLPEISGKQEEVKIKQEEIKLETFRASGPGGQYVNKRETAVRITHLPTGIVVACQSERLQGLNRDKAMKVLLAKLLQLKEAEKEKELKEIKTAQKKGEVHLQGETISAGWGNQIRSYVLHPYKMVKDLRTGVETSDVEGVLDGKLDEFIEAEMKMFR